jgi:hypothetical protein
MRTVQLWQKAVDSKSGVRKVPISSTSLTGSVLGVDFESSLERDLILLMTFHRYLDWYQSQPLKVEFKGADGKDRSYTPDLLVRFTETSPEARLWTPMLCEVKYEEDLLANWAKYKPKFKAATKFARSKGWRFKIYTEKRIRTAELENIQFLWRYRFAHYEKTFSGPLIEALKTKRGETTMYEILRELYSTDEDRGLGIWTWWCLVANRHILCDLTTKITKDTLFWLPEWRYR